MKNPVKVGPSGEAEASSRAAGRPGDAPTARTETPEDFSRGEGGGDLWREPSLVLEVLADPGRLLGDAVRADPVDLVLDAQLFGFLVLVS